MASLDDVKKIVLLVSDIWVSTQHLGVYVVNATSQQTTNSTTASHTTTTTKTNHQHHNTTTTTKNQPTTTGYDVERVLAVMYPR
jgi:Tfp pilus assembly major pilin PilA